MSKPPNTVHSALKSLLALIVASILAAAIAAFTVLVTTAALSARALDVLESYCEDAPDGVWNPNGAKCHRESCYESQSCIWRSYPAAYCRDVKIGDPISRVVLHLGEPMTTDGNRLEWTWSKSDHGVGVEAEFRNGMLISLHCPAAPLLTN